MEAVVAFEVPGEDLTVHLADPAWLSDTERLDAWRELRTARNRIEAAMVRLVGDIERDESHQVEDAPTVTSWLIAQGEAASRARSTVAIARAVQHMPCVAGAFERGELDTLRVRHLAGAREVEPEVFARDEALLVDTIVGLPARDARTALDYWRQAAAPEAADVAEQRAHDLRRLFVSPTWGGLVRVDGQLGREAGAVVMAALDSLTDPGALDPTDTRSAPQRRADALTDLCRDHLDHGDAPVAGGEKPHVTLHVSRRALRGEADDPCELEEAGVVTPLTARRIACDASITEITEDHAGTALDVGRRTRVVPAATRRALVARDRGCVICGRPARWCDAHHVLHWADGGPTSLDNLVLLCRFHHRGVHEGRTRLPAPVLERARAAMAARAPPSR